MNLRHRRRRLYLLFITAVAVAIAVCGGGVAGSDDPGMVRIFNRCTNTTNPSDCRLMNGECFPSRGNDIGPYCSCGVGYTFDARNAYCERQSIITAQNASRIVAVTRTSNIYYLEQRGLTNLNRGKAKFPRTWTCDTLSAFCWTTDNNAYITAFDTGTINTDNTADTYIRYRDVIFKCLPPYVYFRRNDDMTSDPDEGGAARPLHENCVLPSDVCSSIGTGVASGTGCLCNNGWSGPTCQISTVLNISRPVIPSRFCAFPSNTTCAPDEQCYLWEGSPNATQGYCWCSEGHLPAAAADDTLTPLACVKTPTHTFHGALASPYTRDAPSYTLTVDARSRQYVHYRGQGYAYASILPYPMTLTNTYFRINDTVADTPGYLYSCDWRRAYWDPVSRECVLNWAYVPPTASLSSVPPSIAERIFYTGCTMPNEYGPDCSQTPEECAEVRCSGHGTCVGVYQGCACDHGWGLYNCSERTCYPNLFDPSMPHVWRPSVSDCNCSDAYRGIFCEYYTCGNAHATYRPPEAGGCICGGDWTLDSTGNCTVHPCKEWYTLSSLNPSKCVPNKTFEENGGKDETTPEVPGGDIFLLLYNVTDDWSPVKPYEPSVEHWFTICMFAASAVSMLFPLMKIAGLFHHL